MNILKLVIMVGRLSFYLLNCLFVSVCIGPSCLNFSLKFCKLLKELEASLHLLILLSRVSKHIKVCLEFAKINYHMLQ